MYEKMINDQISGIAYDLYDGHQALESLSKDSKKLALQNKPSLLEIFGHCLFPSSFLIGPQFPMKKYQEFVSGYQNNKVNIEV